MRTISFALRGEQNLTVTFDELLLDPCFYCLDRDFPRHETRSVDMVFWVNWRGYPPVIYNTSFFFIAATLQECSLNERSLGFWKKDNIGWTYLEKHQLLGESGIWERLPDIRKEIFKNQQE